MSPSLKAILMITAVVISVVGVLLSERLIRSRAHKRLKARPQRSPSEFAAAFYPDAQREVPQRVRRVLDSVAATFHLDTAGAQPSDHILKDLSFDDLDSLSTVELVMALEKEFAIKISNSDAASLHTVGEIVEFIGLKTERPSTTDGPKSTPAA
jgi:acyl carrier protein